jgi:hypothetical protein
MTRLGFSLLLALPLLALACGSSSGPPPGKTCLMNSDCNNPLSCTFGKCHAACAVTRDCPTGERCVKGPAGNVCQLTDEKLCPVSGGVSNCMSPLVCAIDLQCRNHCTVATATVDCTAGQLCAGGYCAEKRELNPDGTLMVGAPTADAGSADAGMPSPDAGPTPEVGPTPDAPADTAPSGALGPCGVPEQEPNDTREQATAIAAPIMLSSCIGTPEDRDFYELTAPSDPGGGYYQFSITGVNFDTDVLAYNVADQGEIGHIYAASDGQDLFGYLAVAPGKKYRLSIGSFISTDKAPTPYKLNLTYTKVDDAQEPNESVDAPKAITLGAPVTGYLFGGLRTVPPKEEALFDWYTVMGAAAPITATVENVPSNMTVYIKIIDPTGHEATAIGSNDGANVTVTKMDGTAGAYKVLVQPFTVQSADFFGHADDATMVPAHFTHPYKLTVSQ